MFRLDGRVSLVTGSTSGIGKAIAKSLAQAGSHIILNGRRDPAECEEQRANLENQYGVRVIYLQADMSNPAEITKMVGDAAMAFQGKIDILVNNAGSQHVSPVEKFPLEKWNEIIAVHQTAPFVAMQAVIPHMRRHGWGRIINVASAHGTIASPGKVAYVAAKHGMMGLTKTIALEVAENGITCNTISPGYVWTPLVENQIKGQSKTLGISVEDVEREVFMKAHATRKFTTVEQVGQVALFLCSEAAANITGSDHKMDGGWTAGQVPYPLKRPEAKAAPNPDGAKPT